MENKKRHQGAFFLTKIYDYINPFLLLPFLFSEKGDPPKDLPPSLEPPSLEPLLPESDLSELEDLEGRSDLEDPPPL